MKAGEPLFLKIAEAIRSQIYKAGLKPHTRLPSEPDLVRRYGAARATVRRALQKLQQDGLIYSRRAAGSFIAEPRIDQDLDQLFSFTEFMVYRGVRPGTRVLLAQSERIRDAASPLIRHLRLRPGAAVFHIRRLRLGGQQPMVVANTWLPAQRFKGFLKQDLTKKSIYDIMQSAGHKPTDAVQTIESVLLEAPEAELLSVNVGDPAFLIRRIGYAKGIPVEYAVDYYRGDCTKFRVRLGVLEHRLSQRIDSDDLGV